MKMKFISSAFYFFSILSTFAQDANAYRSRLESAERSISERYRNPVAVVEKRNSSWAKVESFAQLQAYLKSSWQTSIQQIHQIAMTDTQKAIYFKAAQILPRAEYIAFVTMATEQVKAGHVSKQQLKWALFPFEKHLREMWTENPPSEALTMLANRSRMVMADDVSMTKFLERVLSGKVASENASQAAAEAEALEKLRMQRQTVTKEVTNASPSKATQNASPSVQVELPNSSESCWSVLATLVLGAIGLLLYSMMKRK